MRLPAYARKLIQALDAGEFPPRVWVIWGDDWQRLPDGHALCIKPAEYQPGLFDFNLLSFLRVDVVDRVGGDDPALYRCMAEIGQHASALYLHHWNGDSRAMREHAELMYCLRQRGQWIEGWSDACQQQYMERFEQYITESIEDLQDDRLAA